jgi:hypothetical protein
MSAFEGKADIGQPSLIDLRFMSTRCRIETRPLARLGDLMKLGADELKARSSAAGWPAK